MKEFRYRPQGVCSTRFIMTINDDRTINEFSVVDGCAGNSAGIARLVVGLTIDEVIDKLRGVKCGRKPTSCPDQLATALLSIKGEL